MIQSAEKDAEIGEELYQRLQRLAQRLSRQHAIPRERAADYLLAGALFTAAEIYELSIDQTVSVMQEIARSVQEDELPDETRH